MGTTLLYTALVMQSADEGLTLAEVIESLPTDLGSFFALALLVAFFGAIVYFGTRSGTATPGDSSTTPPSRTPGQR